MVFGAMTQGNGFESGYSLRNIRWTGDFYSNAQASTLIRFTGVDVNTTGSNIYFVNTASAAGTANVLHVLTLSQPYQLSSVTARVSPALNLSNIFSGLSFTSDGYIYTAKSPSNSVFRSTSAYGTGFVLTPPIAFTNTNMGNGTPYYVASTGALTTSNVLYNNQDTTTNSPAVSGNLSYTSTANGTTTELSITVPAQTRFQTGMAGSCFNAATRRLFTLENANVVQNTMFLTTTYFSAVPINNARANPKYQRVNLYPLFPSAMKPTMGHGICVDRDKGQYLFVCCTIGANEYIVKFQMRSI